MGNQLQSFDKVFPSEKMDLRKASQTECRSRGSDPIAPTSNRLVLAKAWVRAQTFRREALGGAQFSDPAWNMLLELYIAQVQCIRLCVSDLHNSSDAPLTTALRYMKLLEARGMMQREPDPFDRRRIYVSLTPVGAERIEYALDKAAESDRRLGLERLHITN